MYIHMLYIHIYIYILHIYTHKHSNIYIYTHAYFEEGPTMSQPCAGPGRLGSGAARAACGQRPGGLEEPLGPVAWSWGTATWVHWGYGGILMGDY